MNRISSIIFCTLLLLASCAKDEVADGFYSSTEWTQYTVAVVAPLSESTEYKERIERITDWFSENFHKGQMRMEKGVSLKLEWYDESAMSIEDIQQLGRDFAGREDLAAVVGPFYSTPDFIARSTCVKPFALRNSLSLDAIRFGPIGHKLKIVFAK